MSKKKDYSKVICKDCGRYILVYEAIEATGRDGCVDGYRCKKCDENYYILLSKL